MEVDATEADSPFAEENSLNKAAVIPSDVEDISDVDIEDAEDQFQKTISSKPTYNERRRSIFNTTLEINESPRPVCVLADTAAEMLEAKVAQEQKEWDNFIKNSKRKPDAAEYKPSAEQQAYLNQGPNLQNYIRGMSTIMNEGNRFMQEFEEMRELQEGLQDICQFLVMNEQRVNIAECLSRV